MLRPLAPALWVVETPLRFLGMQVGRLMTVVRLADGGLLVHSPAELGDELRKELDALGEVRVVVPASSLHGHLFMEQYRAAYPRAALFAAPGLERRRKDLTFDGALGDEPDSRWRDDLDQMRFEGHRNLTEIPLFHRRSRTLVLGDLGWNITPTMPAVVRLWAGRRSGFGPTRPFRLGLRDKEAVRRSTERVLEWDFDRIIPGHGEIVDSDGREAFRAAYGSLYL